MFPSFRLTGGCNPGSWTGAVELAVVLQLQVAVEDIKLGSAARLICHRHLLCRIVQVRELIPTLQINSDGGLLLTRT